MQFGDFKIVSLSDGFFRLDGGAMFGVVPKVLWEKTNPPDDKNRILLGLNPLLIQAGGENILVDTGIGDKGDAKFQAMFDINRNPTLQQSLRRLGLSDADISIVIDTHLHFDHAGGNTVQEPDGTIRPTFRNARYFVQRGEWEDATQPNERTQASYLGEDFLPVMEAGQMELIDGDQEILPGISVFKTSGHNRHIQLVRLESQGKAGLFFSDIVPTTSHLRYPYIMGYDLFPLDTLQAKKDMIRQAAAEGWLCIFVHDPKFTMGYVRMEAGKPVFEPVDGTHGKPGEMR